MKVRSQSAYRRRSLGKLPVGRQMSLGDGEPAGAADAVPLQPYSESAGWQYRAEGGANIVISVPRLGLVLRFPKKTHADMAARLRRLADYRQHVIAPLLGERGAAPWRVVRLSADDRCRLAAAIEERRPPRRRAEAMNAAGLALMMDDCAVFPGPGPVPAAGPAAPVFSVEIKAKQGFLGPDDDLDVCGFCMKQYLKMKRGEVQRVSDYCPLDLFSGQFSRVDRALRALLDCPQNNLRVFRDGELLYGARASTDRTQLHAALAAALPELAGPPDSLLGLWTHLMYTVLCTTEAECRPLEGGQWARPHDRCLCGPGPPADSFLGRVLRGQRLASLGPTLTAQHYDQVMAVEPSRRRLEEAFAAPFSSPLWTSVVAGADATPAADPVLALQRYSVGATMRDSSLMITMRRAGPADDGSGFRTVTDLAGNRWVCLCRVVDLDPKHIRRVRRQRLQKEKSRELYLRARLPRDASHGVPIPCSVSDESIERLLAVSGSPI